MNMKDLLTQLWDIMPYLIAVGFVIGKIPVVSILNTTGYNDFKSTEIVSIADQKERSCLMAVIIPGTRNKCIPADNSFYVGLAEELFTTLFGGCTSVPAKGNCILEETNQHSKESVVPVMALATQDEVIRCEKIIEEFALYLKTELNQESVSVIINGKLKFI
jgi:hypothetical protein